MRPSAAVHLHGDARQLLGPPAAVPGPHLPGSFPNGTADRSAARHQGGGLSRPWAGVLLNAPAAGLLLWQPAPPLQPLLDLPLLRAPPSAAVQRNSGGGDQSWGAREGGQHAAADDPRGAAAAGQRAGNGPHHRRRHRRGAAAQLLCKGGRPAAPSLPAKRASHAMRTQAALLLPRAKPSPCCGSVPVPPGAADLLPQLLSTCPYWRRAPLPSPPALLQFVFTLTQPGCPRCAPLVFNSTGTTGTFAGLKPNTTVGAVCRVCAAAAPPCGQPPRAARAQALAAGSAAARRMKSTAVYAALPCCYSTPWL
jgi:hypothetical protein